MTINICWTRRSLFFTTLPIWGHLSIKVTVLGTILSEYITVSSIERILPKKKHLYVGISLRYVTSHIITWILPYRKTLQIARHLVDRALEAQACYSLGNTYTLLRDFERAIEYHLLHLVIAQELGDKIGEGRACWSLGNAHTALHHHEEALQFASQHLKISKQVGLWDLMNRTRNIDIYPVFTFVSLNRSVCGI